MTGNIIYSCISAYATILKKMILTSNKREKKPRVEEGGGGENFDIHEHADN